MVTSNNNPLNKFPFKLVRNLGIFVFIAIFLRPFTIVTAGQRGVVMKFGKVEDYILDEGLHPIIPIITSVKKISVRVEKNSFQAEAASKDLQKVDTELAVNWHIDPIFVNKVYQQLGNQEEIVTGIINPVVTEILKANTNKKTAEQIIAQRSDLKEDIEKDLKSRLTPYHLMIDDVALVNFSFSHEFNAAIEAKQVAEQEAKQAEFVAQKATQEAQAEINRARGQAESQRLLRLTLTPELLQKQAIEKWDGHFPMVMGGNGTLPLININSHDLANQTEK